MAEGIRSTFKLLGCGCLLIIVFFLMLSSFVLGAKYGKELVEDISERIGRVMKVVNDTTSDTKNDVKKTVKEINNEVENVYN